MAEKLHEIVKNLKKSAEKRKLFTCYHQMIVFSHYNTIII